MRIPTVGHLIRKVSSPRTVLQLRTDAAADRSDAYSSLLQCIAVPSRVGLSVCPSGADSPLQYSGSFPHRLGYQKCDNQHGVKEWDATASTLPNGLESPYKKTSWRERKCTTAIGATTIFMQSRTGAVMTSSETNHLCSTVLPAAISISKRMC